MGLADRRQAAGDGAGLGHLGQLHQVQRHRLGRRRQRHEPPVVGPGAELGPVGAVGPHGGLGLGRLDVAPRLVRQLLETGQGTGVSDAGDVLPGALLGHSGARYLPIIARQKRGRSSAGDGHPQPIPPDGGAGWRRRHRVRLHQDPAPLALRPPPSGSVDVCGAVGPGQAAQSPATRRQRGLVLSVEEGPALLCLAPAPALARRLVLYLQQPRP